jgi:hypothetical protein
MPHYGKVFLASERTARRIQVFDSSIIPGLLQTPEYARALIRVTLQGCPDAEVTGQVELRLSRRKVFDAEETPGRGPRRNCVDVVGWSGLASRP